MKITALCSAWVVALATASLSARPFVATGFEAGGGLQGVGGAGFTTSGLGFYNPLGNPTNTSVQPAVASSPWTEAQSYDSYFTLSAAPARVTAADGGVDSLSPQILSFYGYTGSYDVPTTIAASGSHIGATGDNDGAFPYSPATPVDQARAGISFDSTLGGPVASALNPRSGQHGVFIAQLTLKREASLGGGIVLNLLTAPGITSSAALALNGPAVSIETSPGVFEFVHLRSYVVASNPDLGHSRSGGNEGPTPSQRFGAADVWHLWIEVVPSPGAVGAFVLGAIGAARRRRP
jgi:hypothetical protein